jgi:hypothetical protein
VYPVVLGKGKRILEFGTVPAALRLVDPAIFPNGRLKLDFATAGEPSFGNVGAPEEALKPLTWAEREGFLTRLGSRRWKLSKSDQSVPTRPGMSWSANLTQPLRRRSWR